MPPTTAATKPPITSYKRWLASIGQAVPLRLVPRALGRSPHEVAMLIRDGRLRVHEFRANDGRVFRMVPLADLRATTRNPLLDIDARAAFRRVADRWLTAA